MPCIGIVAMKKRSDDEMKALIAEDRCPVCGEKFEKIHRLQVYCSETCYQAADRRKVKAQRLRPSVRFECAHCGKTVITDPESGDKRSRFCSKECERKYWRHPPQDYSPRNQCFQSAGQIAAYEKRTNEIWSGA